MWTPVDLRRPRGLGEAGAAALGALREDDRPVHERADVGLHRLPVLGQERLLDLRDQPGVGEVDALDLELRRLLVEQVVQLPLRELRDRLVGREEAAAAQDPAEPAVHAHAGDRDRALVDRLGVVVERGEVEVRRRAPALAAGAHAAGDAELAALLDLPAALLEGDRPRPTDRRHVERERLRPADVRLAEPAEQDAQHRAGVGGGADGGADVAAHPLLADDDRGGQPVEDVDVRPVEGGHQALQERAVRLVDHPLGLGGDRREHQRALARAGDAGEDREPALGQLDAHVAQVVLARAVDADQVVAVGRGLRRGASVLVAVLIGGSVPAGGCVTSPRRSGSCFPRGRGRRRRGCPTAARWAPGRPRRRRTADARRCRRGRWWRG